MGVADGSRCTGDRSDGVDRSRSPGSELTTGALPARAWWSLGVGLSVGAGALAFAAFAGRDRGPGDVPQTVERAVAVDLPETIAPVSSPPVTVDVSVTATVPPPAARPAISATTTLPISPVAAALPERLSAIASDATAPQPVLLGVPDIEVMVPVAAIGFEPDGQLEIPDETTAGWYRFGSAPGQAGATVVAAHVSWNDTIGPFFRLGELEPGALIQLDLADGSSRQYSVVERTQYPKLMLPRERIWTRTGDETLVLITCGGDFNRSIRRYTDNVVVYAVPVAAEQS